MAAVATAFNIDKSAVPNSAFVRCAAPAQR
jgi:hypothetical protein